MGVTYTIGALAGLTGLSPHTIRAWERRYGALSPGRSGTNRRIYEADDVERLILLRRMVESGHSIGQIAHLPTHQLQAFLSTQPPREVVSQSRILIEEPDRYLATCLDSLVRLDRDSLEEGLVRGAASLGVLGLLEKVVVPLLSSIESGWLDGSVRISQEHLAVAVLRTYLDRTRLSMPSASNAPRLLITTPRGQHHEIGALMAATVAGLQSWNVTYLGPNLPREDIVDAVRRRRANAVGLSLVYPVDDAELPNELRRLRAELGSRLPILVGGRAVADYAEVLESIGAEVCTNFRQLQEVLDGIVAGDA